jgi:hypothetical protein
MMKDLLVKYKHTKSDDPTKATHEVKVGIEAGVHPMSWWKAYNIPESWIEERVDV